MDRIYMSSPDVGPLEREALLRAFDSGWIAPVGPELDAFESEISALTGWGGTVALTSGTAALHLALKVHGVGPGDDVFVSTFTFAATPNAVIYCGATPVFVDSEASTWNMSPQLLSDQLKIAKRQNRLPKAVVLVDLYGQCADYDEIVPQCRELGIPVIEDAAEAIGSLYKGRPAGTLGDVGVFSFNGNKIMTTSGGGALISPDRTISDKVRYLATQARQPAAHYEHTEVGYNYRLSNLLAAMGRAQLARLPEMAARRQQINESYRAQLGGLAGVSFMPIAPWGGWNSWLTCVVFDKAAMRDEVQRCLEARDIESRPVWKPMHLQPVFAGSEAAVDGTSQALFERGLCLPSGSVLSDDQVDWVAKIVRETVSLGL
jgi:dTDP-4-amino-4,6-dideoxygalactose transaminase